MTAAAGSRTADEQRATDLCAGAGQALEFEGDLRTATPWHERALARSLAIREPTPGLEHPLTARILNGLARLLYAQGELDAARPLCERALDIRERDLGPDHPLTALSLNDLALLLSEQGEPDAARPLFERALAIRERVLGPDQPDTVATRRALEELAAEEAGWPTADG